MTALGINSVDALLILNAIPGFGNRRALTMIDHFGSAQKVLAMSTRDLVDAGVPQKAADQIARFPKDDFLRVEHQLIKKDGVQLLGYEDEEYPEFLKAIPDAPIILYWKGARLETGGMSIAIVGSRKASFYGLSAAEKFAGGMAELGITVVSGMARGIDTAAHRGTIRAGGATIAVLGSGLGNIYPPENEGLFAKIAQTGAVVSEFPMQTQPIAYNFPRRNRIISGMSLGVIVMEAFQRSGALITARLALEQGREVFALPGNIGSLTAQGTNSLIKEGAKLVTCLEDVLEDLKPQLQEMLKQESVLNSNSKSTSSAQAPKDLSEQEQRVYQVLSGEPMHIDFLADQLGVELGKLSPITLNMEIRSLIKQLPGKYYVRC